MDFHREATQLFKLRRIMSKAWIPMGISREEAVDILLWAVGEDVYTLHITKWPARIMDRTGIKFDPAITPLIKLFRVIGKKWKDQKPLIFHSN